MAPRADLIDVHEEVAAALAAGAPVVALESTLIAHGLPRPANLELARRLEALVREGGAVPATIAVLAGRVKVGLAGDELAQIARRDDVAKASLRDLGPVLAAGVPGATTVAGTAHLAVRAGIPVFATGGLGGVHRDAARSFDESADLLALAAAQLVVVCAGVKSILDVAKTLERLETLSIPVVGYGTDRLPGFYLADSGHALSWRVETAAQVAAIRAARARLGLPQALVVANPVPAAEQMDPALHDRVLAEALVEARREGVGGRELTPFVLAYFHSHTRGESVRVNVRIVEGNAALAASIAVALRGV